MTVDTGQLVVVRKTSVSAGIGVRNRRIASLLAGMRVMVGRFAPLTATSGNTEVNVWKGWLPGFGATKNGRASAAPDNSYCAAIEETLSLNGASLYRMRTMFRRSCSSFTRRIASL